MDQVFQSGYVLLTIIKIAMAHKEFQSFKIPSEDWRIFKVYTFYIKSEKSQTIMAILKSLLGFYSLF